MRAEAASLYHRLQQHWILDSLREVRDGTHILMDIVLSHSGNNPMSFFLMIPLGNDRKYWTDPSPNDHEDEHLVSYVLLVLLLLLF